MTLPTAVDEVLEFWFAPPTRERWFNSTPAFDAQVRARFEAVWRAAADGELDHWAQTPAGAVALVVVLDQFPLNMYRGRAESFATEARSREVAERALALGFDRELRDAEKAFLYMPFMHSEDPADQARSVSLYEAAGLEHNLKWARHHRDLIARFGRFPHRNALLGRADTAAEREYLASVEAFHG